MELTKVLREYRGPAVALTLDYEGRRRSRQRVRLDDGRIAFLVLPRGTTLRDGDCLRGDNSRVVRVIAAAEPVSTIAVDDPMLLARAAFHLGNRHEPVQIGDGWLRYRRDHVLDAMLREQGLCSRHEEAPFEPERGAYGHAPPADAEFSAGSGPDRDGGAAPEIGADRAASASVDPALLHLLRLASPALPIGSFAYSQGLEQAVELGWITDEATTAEWLIDLLAHVQAGQELPLFARLYRAWREGDTAGAGEWNARVIALRETAELRAEERDTGTSLARLLNDLGMVDSAPGDHGYTSLYACAAARLGIAPHDAAGGFVWTWCQNQVAAAIRLVPLGQTAGQRILARLVAEIPGAVRRGLALGDEDIGFSAPGLALASARHERQYTRLFLS